MSVPMPFRSIVAAVIAAPIVCGTHGAFSAKDGHGLKLDNPGLIDAVASVLFPYLPQESFTREDEMVLVELMGGYILQLQRLPGRDCAFQTRRLNESDPVIQQYNFGQLTGEYRTVSNGGGLSSNILFDGEGAWCEKENAGLRCWNSIHTTVGGLNDSRKVLRAMSFIQQKFCPPAKPRQPF